MMPDAEWDSAGSPRARCKLVGVGALQGGPRPAWHLLLPPLPLQQPWGSGGSDQARAWGGALAAMARVQGS